MNVGQMSVGQTIVGQMNCRSNELSVKWTVGQMNVGQMIVGLMIVGLLNATRLVVYNHCYYGYQTIEADDYSSLCFHSPEVTEIS